MKNLKLIVPLLLATAAISAIEFAHAQQKDLCAISIKLDPTTWAKLAPTDAVTFEVKASDGVPAFVTFRKPEIGSKYTINVCVGDSSIIGGFVDNQNMVVQGYATKPFDNTKLAKTLKFPQDFIKE